MHLEDRREILEGLILPDDRIQFSQALPGGDAKAIFHLIDEAGIEGMVSKRQQISQRPVNCLAKDQELYGGGIRPARRRAVNGQASFRLDG
jgi:hypothetical protein